MSREEARECRGSSDIQGERTERDPRDCTCYLQATANMDSAVANILLPDFPESEDIDLEIAAEFRIPLVQPCVRFV